MLGKFLSSLKPNRESFEWLLVMFTVSGLFVLAGWKDVDVNNSLCVLVGSYLSARATVKASSHWAASRDPQANTENVIKETESK